MRTHLQTIAVLYLTTAIPARTDSDFSVYLRKQAFSVSAEILYQEIALLANELPTAAGEI